MGIRTRSKKKRTPQGTSDNDKQYPWGKAGQKANQPKGFEHWELEKRKPRKKK